MDWSQIELYHIQIPFRLPFQHSLAVHQASNNLVVKLTAEQGISGYGEGVPRDFVTGESMADSLRMLTERRSWVERS